MRIMTLVLAGFVTCWSTAAHAQQTPFANLFVGGGYLLAGANVAPANSIGIGADVDFNVTDDVAILFDWG